jgi:hypothetical protein
VGAAWDVTGNGKTVAKASWGMFGDTMGSLRQRVQPERHRVTDLCVDRSVRDDSVKNNTFNNASCDVDAAFLARCPRARR